MGERSERRLEGEVLANRLQREAQPSPEGRLAEGPLIGEAHRDPILPGDGPQVGAVDRFLIGHQDDLSGGDPLDEQPFDLAEDRPHLLLDRWLRPEFGGAGRFLPLPPPESLRRSPSDGPDTRRWPLGQRWGHGPTSPFQPRGPAPILGEGRFWSEGEDQVAVVSRQRVEEGQLVCAGCEISPDQEGQSLPLQSSCSPEQLCRIDQLPSCQD